MTKKRARVFVSGWVQGVFFRANTKKKAQSLGALGWVRNLSDGNVEAVIEGEKAIVEEVVRWCTDDQPYATVTDEEMDWQEPTGEFTDFEIKY